LNREPSTAARALRAVSLVITLVSLVTFTTIVYSAYTDVSGVFSTFGSASSHGSASPIVVTGNTARIGLNYSIQNGGLYPLLIALSCQPDASLPVSCADVSVSIPAGSTQVVGLTLTVTDLTKLRSLVSAGKPLHLNATAAASLEPFATLSAEFDLGSILSGAVP
jgi:hypothetical protein